jgi:hypothetical protein
MKDSKKTQPQTEGIQELGEEQLDQVTGGRHHGGHNDHGGHGGHGGHRGHGGHGGHRGHRSDMAPPPMG